MGASLTTKTKSRGRRTGGTYRPMAEINVTPFVDVMLVLLIIFMVSAPMMTAGVQVDLPDSTANAITTDDNKPIEISITKENKIYIGDTEIAEDILIERLSAMSDTKAEQRIYIRGDQSLDYGRIMNILGRVNAAGFLKVALISKSQ